MDIKDMMEHYQDDYFPIIHAMTDPQTLYIKDKKVERLYKEAYNSFGVQSWTPTVQSCRTILHYVTLALGASRNNVSNFADDINWLKNNHWLPPGADTWAHVIRTKGNRSIHETENSSRDDAASMLYLTAMLLRHVWEVSWIQEWANPESLPRENEFTLGKIVTHNEYLKYKEAEDEFARINKKFGGSSVEDAYKRNDEIVKDLVECIAISPYFKKAEELLKKHNKIVEKHKETLGLIEALTDKADS